MLLARDILAGRLSGWTPTQARAVLQKGGSLEYHSQYADAADAMIADQRGHGVKLISWMDDEWPQSLRNIASAPPLLWLQGTMPTPPKGWIAVVGTRNPTPWGVNQAIRLTEQAIDKGWWPVSGLALGIDTLSHQVAIRKAVPTIAIMGGGLPDIYPRANSALAGQIIEEGGCLLSEQYPYTSTVAGGLLARNRLQSGLASCVLIVQSDIRGGTMTTARYALLQKRPIVCPQPPSDEERSAGVRALLTSTPAQMMSLCGWTDRALRSQTSEICARRPGEEPLPSSTTRTLF